MNQLWGPVTAKSDINHRPSRSKNQVADDIQRFSLNILALNLADDVADLNSSITFSRSSSD
eukprot:CAMPEP_0114545868 /NCGR_PEP_ID=MMETSP0114-20121206/3638_1 /TAXON_ID=31324 /ORGANISM="Goniomonas sp, Strain m" /LENGTH=60 /DNA_ID=CAMNT_0001730341 /DNA_START=109 /DNA_END=291 /DNA_ORIENTATION=-